MKGRKSVSSTVDMVGGLIFMADNPTLSRIFLFMRKCECERECPMRLNLSEDCTP